MSFLAKLYTAQPVRSWLFYVADYSFSPLPVFDPNFFFPGAFKSYLQLFYTPHLNDSPDHFKPHSLCIGGQTFYTIKGISANLQDFLTRRVINRCSLRYFRASPVGILQALRAFYASLHPRPLSLHTS